MTTYQAKPPVMPVGRRGTAARLTVLSGLLGALSAALIIAWPDQVTEARYSYSFDARSYTAAQLFFAVQHLALLPGLVALVSLCRESSRSARIGAWLAALGMVGLTGCELFAITAADSASRSAAADTVNAAYGGPALVLGLGLVLAGAGLARHHVLPGQDRWVVLALGLWIFVVLMPALFSTLVVGRLAIGGWMLLFTWWGLALLRHDRSGRGATLRA